MLQGRTEKLFQEQYKDVDKVLSFSEIQEKYLMGRSTVSRWKKKVKAYHN